MAPAAPEMLVTTAAKEEKTMAPESKKVKGLLSVSDSHSDAESQHKDEASTAPGSPAGDSVADESDDTDTDAESQTREKRDEASTQPASAEYIYFSGGDDVSTQPDSPEGESASPLSMEAKLPSEGSVGHFDGTCKRCCFFPKGRCSNGASCEFCHFDHEKRARASKSQKKKAKAEEEGNMPPGLEAPPGLSLEAPPGLEHYEEFLSLEPEPDSEPMISCQLPIAGRAPPPAPAPQWAQGPAPPPAAPPKWAVSIQPTHDVPPPPAGPPEWDVSRQQMLDVPPPPAAPPEWTASDDVLSQEVPSKVPLEQPLCLVQALDRAFPAMVPIKYIIGSVAHLNPMIPAKKKPIDYSESYRPFEFLAPLSR